MKADRRPRLKSREGAAIAMVVVVALLIGELAVFRRADLTRPGALVFSDAAYSLFVAAEVLSGARLYRDVACPYGWLPVAAYATLASAFGNTPTVYLQFLLVVSATGLALAYLLTRRFLPVGLSLVVTLGGLLPIFVLPGSLLGGYLSSYYMPLERLLLILAALVWRPPLQRTRTQGAALGAIAAALQMTRFGPGVVLFGAIVGIDALLVWPTSRAGFRQWLRSLWPMAAAAATGELLLISVSFALLPVPIAKDLLWPAYFTEVYAQQHGRRWPDLSNWRLDVAQYANPAVSIVLTATGVFTVLRRRQVVENELWALFLLPLLFVLGTFTLFKMDHHLRQFAWVFVLGSVAALARWPWSWALAVAGWAPVAAVVGLSVIRGPDSAHRLVDLPVGWTLASSQAENLRIEGIHQALNAIEHRSGRGPVLFDPSGAGFYVMYGVPHVSRHTWFYPAAVRPYEIQDLAQQYRALQALVVCRTDKTAGEPQVLFNKSFPEALRTSLAARVAELVWRDDDCRVYRLQRPPAP
jgi:hypothetical protein